jgi:hypothetical protein
MLVSTSRINESPDGFTHATGLRAPPSNEPPSVLVQKEGQNVFEDEKQWEVRWEEGEQANPLVCLVPS